MSSDTTTQVYRIWIRTTAERIWAAITDPEWNGRYGHGAPAFMELKPGGEFRSMASTEMKEYGAAHGFGVPDTIVDGEIIEVDEPRKLVQTWRMLMDPQTAAEPFTTLTYEIEESPDQPGVCKLTVTHEITGAPATADMVSGADNGSGAGGGWAWILSDLKTLLESGTNFAGR